MKPKLFFARAVVVESVMLAVLGAAIGALALTYLFVKEVFSLAVLGALMVVGGIAIGAGVFIFFLRPRLMKEFLAEHGINALPGHGNVIPLSDRRGRYD